MEGGACKLTEKCVPADLGRLKPLEKIFARAIKTIILSVEELLIKGQVPDPVWATC